MAMATEESVIIVKNEDDSPIPPVEVYDRTFPIWGQEAIALGHEIPKPFGFSVIYFDLSQPLVVENIGISELGSLGGLIPVSGDQLDINTGLAEQKAKNITFRADMWLLPFLNVYAVLGKTEGTSKATINSVAYDLQCPGGAGGFICRETQKGLDKQLENIQGAPFNLDYDGGTYGAGATLVGGIGNWFAMTDFNYTYTDLNILDGRIRTFVMSPRVGYRFKTGGVESRVWLGAMFQDVEQNFSGNLSDIVTLPPELGGIITPDSKFDVSQRLVDRWNGTAGFMLEIDRSFEVLFEIGFGERTSAMGSLGYRF